MEILITLKIRCQRGATVSWTLGELNAFEAATALGFEPAEVEEEVLVVEKAQKGTVF